MQVIFNADDFGRSSDINCAVVQAHREGVLTSASLMVTGDAVEEAVGLARATPTLAVGLHLVLSDGRPASPAEEIPHLAGRTGRFPANPARVWIQYIFSAAARAEMACEVRTQLERFAATGLPLDHVDAHQHIHMHPAVFDVLLPLAQQYAAGGIRLMRDDFWLAVRYDRRSAIVKALWAVVFGILCRRYALALAAAMDRSDQAAARHGLAVTDHVYGLMQSGRMEEAYVLRVLERPQTTPSTSDWSLQAVELTRADNRLKHRVRSSDWQGSAQESLGSVELYFHPTTAPESEPLGPNSGDLTTLLSPTVRQAIEARGWVRATYAALKEES